MSGSEQRFLTEWSRRSFLRAAGTTMGIGLAGCVGEGSDAGSGGGGDMTIAILSAGSLNNALLNGLKPSVDVPVRIESHGSATVARYIDEGLRDPDIVVLADTALFNQPLTPPWYSTFTSNALVIAYNEDTKEGRRIGRAGTDNWYKPIAGGNADIGRTDPKQDPLGYRTLFMFELASRYYRDATHLTDLSRDQIYPETGLISRFETDGIDAAITYRNMAVARDYSYINLPDQIDLSNPRYTEKWYSTVSYTLPNGKNVQGDPIAYGATIRHMSDAALRVFDILTTGNYLKQYGFIMREQFPNYTGTVPNRVTETTRSDKNRSLPSIRRKLSPDVSDLTIVV
jgi:molybdate/tungstate transport system substrate-binding protein